MALLVLDEADRLLEMGFEDDLAAVRRVAATTSFACDMCMWLQPG